MSQKKTGTPVSKKATMPSKRKGQARKTGTGRPSTWTDELVEAICIRLAAGQPLAEICRDENMPGLRTVYDWAATDKDVSARIARAREAGEDVIAAECLRIADTPVEGLIEKMGFDAETGEPVLLERRKEDMLGHRKLQIETRLKLLAKWNPKK